MIRFHDATIERAKEFADTDGVTIPEWVRRAVDRELARRSGTEPDSA